jgi:hypothetical protein
LRGVGKELLLRALNGAAETERFVRHNPWIINKMRREVSPGIYEPRA